MPRWSGLRTLPVLPRFLTGLVGYPSGGASAFFTNRSGPGRGGDDVVAASIDPPRGFNSTAHGGATAKSERFRARANEIAILKNGQCEFRRSGPQARLFV